MVDAERLHGKFREIAIVGADAIEEHHQVTAVKDGGDAACLLHDRGQGDLDEDGVGAVEVASENPFVFGAVDYRSDEWGDPVAGLVYPVLSKLRVVEDLRQAAVLHLHLEGSLQEGGEAMPGVGISQGLVGQGSDFVEPLVEQRIDDLLLVGEATVGGAYADAGMMGDVVEGYVEPVLGEQVVGSGKDALPIELGVLSKRAARPAGHSNSLARNG